MLAIKRIVNRETEVFCAIFFTLMSIDAYYTFFICWQESASR